MKTTTTIRLSTYKLFYETFGDDLQLDAALSRFTSARVGGPAEMFLTVADAQTLQKAIELAYAEQIPYFILGGGSNILVSDEGVRGLVIMNRAKHISFRHIGAHVLCTVESGANLSSLARQCIGKGLAGLEWAVNVPGTVGGAVIGNAGAHGGDMAASLRAATVWEPGRGVRIYNAPEMEYAYRSSVLKKEHGREIFRRVILSAELVLTPESVDVLTARADGFIAHRKQTQPGGATVGSMFKNPENYYAGYLIEAAGLKGYRVGGAHISEKHANFFVNDEEARADDIRGLIAEAWNSVREQFDVEMDLEVELVGLWDFEE
ncbi:MAG: UDP-N-acetylmuramate dehydrogenase [Anaerolineae bacterium]|nr:UDP-N-acetylmuramate dehydrogenase [Anaerolineae bacterium]